MSQPKKAAAVPGASTSAALVSRFQKFTLERWPRAQIKNAPYNPRTITNHARKLLANNLKTVGLLQPVVVNSTTGNLLAGHQRLAAIDALEGKASYSLDVAVVKLTAKKEIEQNIFMNNPAGQGDWDLAALGSLLPKLDVEATGFGQLELETLLGPLGKGLFGEAEQNDETKEAVDDVEAMQTAREEEAEAAKGRRQKMRDTTAAEHDAENTERIVYVMCASVKARQDFVAKLGQPRDTRYVKASELLALLGHASK